MNGSVATRVLPLIDTCGERGSARQPELIIELLRAIRDQVPVTGDPPSTDPDRSPHLSLLNRVRHDEEQNDDEEIGDQASGTKPASGPSTRIRVRACNVLRPWAAAQADPKLIWVDPLTEARNVAMVTWTLAQIWLDRVDSPDEVQLTGDDLAYLWFPWVRPFARTREGDGWLDQSDEDDPQDVRSRADGRQDAQIAPLLSFLPLQLRTGHREVKIRWQPLCIAAAEHRLVKPSAATVQVLTTASRQPVDLAAIEDRPSPCINSIDDILSSKRIANRLDIPNVSIDAPPQKTVDAQVNLTGVDDPPIDPRAPQLIVAAQNYHPCQGVALYSTYNYWRIVAIPGDKLVWLPKPRGAMRQSAETLTSMMLQDLA